MIKSVGLLGATLFASAIALPGAAQTYDAEKAARAKSFFVACSELAKSATADDSEDVIAVCKQSMNDIAGLFTAYPEHTPMDLNMIAIYSGATAYIVVAMDLVLNENRLSVDGCNHANHVQTMYNRLTPGTSEEVLSLLSANAQNVKDILVPWCDETYGAPGNQNNLE